MIPCVRGTQSFYLPCFRRMFCDRSFKSFPLLVANSNRDKTPTLKNRGVQKIENDLEFAELSKMYKAQSQEQEFKEITYENMVHFFSRRSDVNPILLLLSKGIPPPIPGLVYQPDFLDEETRSSLYDQTLQLHTKIGTHRKGASTYKSKGHNLPFERHYKLLYFEDIPGRKIKAQSFTDYGSPGHELTYFINNENIPNLIREGLISHMCQMDPVQALVPDNWRFTFNVYKEKGFEQAGFDWHKDISSNGEITSITTIYGTANLQIRPEDRTSYSATYSLPLTPGSIVLLSGDSRWKWEHRVLSQPSSTNSPIGRISLVLGCR